MVKKKDLMPLAADIGGSTAEGIASRVVKKFSRIGQDSDGGVHAQDEGYCSGSSKNSSCPGRMNTSQSKKSVQSAPSDHVKTEGTI